MSERVSVMVTGIGGGGYGEQIVKALRLARTNYRIVGCDMSPFGLGTAEVDRPYLLPATADPDYLQCVLALCKKHKVVALFPGSEPELKILSRERDRIEKQRIFLPINPQPVIDTCMDKFRTAEFLARHGFPAPKTRRIRSATDAELVDFLPAVLKPSVGGGGSANVLLAQTKEELRAFCGHLTTVCEEVIAQEYVGDPDSEYTVGVLFTMDGELLNSIAVKRFILPSLSNRIKVANSTSQAALGQVLAISNGVSQGEIGSFPDITRPCEEIARRLGCTGTVNLQCRYANGKVYVFEINPRFSGTTSLRAMVGYNEPDLLVRHHLLGKAVRARFPFKSGVIMRSLRETLIERTDYPKARSLL